MNKLIGNYFIILAILFYCSVLTACEKEGPLERTGEKADKAVDDARDKIEDAGDRIEDATN
jgi:predicted small lipoprotein YifL